jgi:hypothetical protein
MWRASEPVTGVLEKGGRGNVVPTEIRQNGNPGKRPACLYDLDQKISNRNNDSITLPNGLDYTIKNETDITAVP